MFYASIGEDERVSPSKGASGTCRLCKKPVIAKCGTRKIWHWAHARGQNDCDPWGESETRWHRDWQERAEPDCCEVVIGCHRADVRLPSGLVIELQHSPIKEAEIREREAFYGDMIWVFDASSLGGTFRVFEDRANGTWYRWMSRRRMLDAVKRPLFLDLGGPLLDVTDFGPQGCSSGRGELVSRPDFYARYGFRPLTDEETKGASHYVLRRGAKAAIVRTIEEGDWFRAWDEEIEITRYDFAGRAEWVRTERGYASS